jgi:aryl-alcohol dehydrogenase-like predicted oxidoreductase
MEQRQLGDTDLLVSRVGLGCNNFGGRIDAAATRAVVDAALDAGITFLDTADIYGHGGGSERLLGEVLEGRRDRVVLATKFGHDMGDGTEARGSAAYVRKAIERSLERLRTDHVDLYYLHVPDPATPIAETLGALDELVREGKVRAIGCSNFSAEQLAEADRTARENGTAHFVAVQNHYNLLHRDDDASVLPLCRELGVAYIPYFPLANGLLTGKVRRGEQGPEGTRLAGQEFDDETFDRIEALERFASERGRALLELAVSALASTDGIGSVIAGSTRPEQVRANAAAGGWDLAPEDLAELESVIASAV